MKIQEKTKAYKDKAKKVVGETATKTVKFTMKVATLIFILIIIYTIAVTLYIFFTTGAGSFLTSIATISVGGFWAFFLGYFGWRMGQTVEVYLYHLRNKK